MDTNKTIEQYKAEELELKKQLEAVMAENQRLELEMKYKDKSTGLWNRKYAEKIISEDTAGAENENFTVLFTDIDNLNIVNEKSGEDAGDALLRKIADGITETFGPEAVCCKMTGARMCIFMTVTGQEFGEKIANFDAFIASVKETASEIEISYGYARHDANPDKDGDGLVKEAEYELQMRKVSREGSDAPVVMQKKAPGEKISVLMIDDSLIILRTLQMMLKDKYKTLMTTSGMEGFEIARTKQPDLILLDYNMPVVDGERIMHLLKESNSTKNIPVIFISGVTDKEKIMKVATLKPAGYLLKPVQKENLLKVIDSVLNA